MIFRSNHPPSGWLADRHFLAALALGPLVWIGVALLPGRTAALWPAPQWIIDSPARFVSLVVLYPVLEELVFRGWLLPVLAARATGRIQIGRVPVTAANVATSAAFALAHLFSQPPAMALATFFPSLVFGHLRERFGRTLPAIAMHAWYNAGFFWIVR